MKKIIFTISVLVSGVAYSQVGIDTETPKATLDVKGKPSDLTKADGIIAPRLKGSELKAKDALYTADQKASLVYVTEALASADTTSKTVNVTSIGYFYFDGNIWQKLTTGSNGVGGNDWSILGNSGTTAATNFIGTTDAVDFVVKTNNTERERTYTTVNSQNEIKKISGGNLNVNGVSVGTANNNDVGSVAVGNNALKINTNGAQNVAVGAGVLSKNTDGYGNVAVGMSALPNNVSGYENVAVGQHALYGNKTGSNNVAVGKSALGNFNNSSGMNNVAIGQQSGELLQSGNSNIVIGSNQNLGSNNGSNQLNIGGAIFGTGLTGSSAAPAGNIGIGTTTPATKLEVNNGTTNGAIKIVDGTQGAGKVLTSDANGLATWQDSATGMGNNWSILGNSGTTAGTNFIGTSDAQDFVVKTNNTEVERTYKAVDASNSIKKIVGGDLNLNGITIGRGAGNFESNTVVGNHALEANVSSTLNTVIGAYSLNKTTTGENNVALGHSSMISNTTGGGNVAVGTNSFDSNTTGKFNVAIGKNALSNTLNKTGSHNIAIGFAAGNRLEDATTNNIVIGSRQQLADSTGNNQLNIGGIIYGTGLTGNSMVPAGNIGIGTATPSTKLEINNGTTNGAIKIVDGTQGNGKVLMSDANGVGTWQSPASIRPTILGVFPTTDILVKSDGGATPKYSEIYIDLLPGKWIVNSGATIYAGIANARYIEHLYLSSSQTAVEQVGFTHLGPAGNNVTVADVINSGSDINDSNSTQNFISGSSVISVTAPTRIYLLFQNKNTNYWSFPTRAWENYFYAIPVN
ncbi:beta strand repeat-containing protein [Chryseobacterium sp. M5]|uniref:beta strand repeat-containing protein n=1 Tax=Chryseobacterium sp. M5 TaxID=3379128 RepID=UPI003857863C